MSDAPFLEEGFARFGEDGGVKELNDGGGCFEALDDLLEEHRAGGGFGREVRGDSPLAADEEVHGGRVGWETLGRAGELLAVELAHEGAEFFGGEEAAHLFVVQLEVSADGEKLFALGHVDAGGDDDLVGPDVEVEAPAGGLLEPGAGPPCPLMRLVGALVGGEADVAVDAEGGLLRGLHIVGGEAQHGLVDGGDNGEGGGLDLLLVDGLSRVEPVAVVVALESAKELQGFGRVVRGGRCHDEYRKCAC